MTVRHESAERRTLEATNCIADEGRSLGVGLQEQTPNYRKLRRGNSRRGERCGKRRANVRQVSAKKTNESEPLYTCRKRMDVLETRLQSLAWDRVWEKPVYCPDGDRHQGGVSLAAGGYAERGNLAPRCEGRSPSGRTMRSRVPKRGAGTDGLVVVKKPGNAGRAKEPDDLAKDAGQPAMGGTGV